MLIIGERINSTRFDIQDAIKARNASPIIKEAQLQIAGGAKVLDVNCAMTSGDEVQDIDWVISVIQSEIRDVSICIDSPNYLAIERALGVYKAKGSLIINSITGEESRMKRILPLAIKYNTKLVALTMTERGMPHTADERFHIARSIYESAKTSGYDIANLYFDPLIRPVSVEPHQPREFLKSIQMIKSMPGAKTICGLSNVSFGLPGRSIINSVFLAMAIQAGLDAVILDPTDKNIISSLKASRTLLGLDEACADYIKAFREGALAT